MSEPPDATEDRTEIVVADVASAFARNPWESLAEMVAWLDDRGAITTADDDAR